MQIGIDPGAQNWAKTKEQLKIRLKKRDCFLYRLSGWKQKEQACNIEMKEGIFQDGVFQHCGSSETVRERSVLRQTKRGAKL